LLDKNFPGWQFPTVSEDDCQSVKSWGGQEAFAQLIQGDLMMMAGSITLCSSN
jgi:hypothetical protein